MHFFHIVNSNLLLSQQPRSLPSPDTIFVLCKQPINDLRNCHGVQSEHDITPLSSSSSQGSKVLDSIIKGSLFCRVFAAI